MTKVVGIDLGTTFSAIAELDDLGNPEVLSDPESGNRITRSAVYFGKDKVIVGEKARDASVTSPKKVVFEVKREMENEVIYSLSNGEFKEDDGISNHIEGGVSLVITVDPTGYGKSLMSAQLKRNME